jgi:hypothetical protein
MRHSSKGCSQDSTLEDKTVVDRGSCHAQEDTLRGHQASVTVGRRYANQHPDAALLLVPLELVQ